MRVPGGNGTPAACPCLAGACYYLRMPSFLGGIIDPATPEIASSEDLVSETSWFSLEGLSGQLPVLLLLPSIAVAEFVHRRSVSRSLYPPGLDQPARRWAMLAILSGIFYLGTFLPMAWLGQEVAFDPESVRTAELFLLHGVLVAGLGAWFALGYGGIREEPMLVSEESSEFAPAPSGASPRAFEELLRQCGLAPREPFREMLYGLTVAPLLWLGVLVVLALVGLALKSGGGAEWLPQEASPMITFMAGLPVLVRLGLSLSAGIVEEVFFRGFLQRRIGILASSALFVIAHLSYGQPIMLVGITLLSFGFAFLTRWRGNVWPAAVAHTFFDAIQLFWVIPSQVAPTDPTAIGIC